MMIRRVLSSGAYVQEEKMKPMKYGVILMALLLAAMIMVPMVSAAEQIAQDNSQQTVSIPTRVQYGVLDEPPFANVTVNPDDNKQQIEFVYVLVQQKWLDTQGSIDKNGSITFTVPSSDVHILENQAGIPAHVPTNYINAVAISADEPVSVLWTPTAVIKLTKNNTTITITCPEQMFLKFNNITETKIQLEAAKKNNLQISGVPRELGVNVSKLKVSPLTSASPAERRWYTATGTNINGVTGIMQPAGFSNPGQSFTSYHEMELYLQQSTDAVEFIVYHHSDGRIIDFVSVHDDYALSSPLTMNVTSLSTYLEWYFYIQSGNVWSLNFRNPIDGTWYTATHTDTVNISNYVAYITPSTELYLDSAPPTSPFYTKTSPFRVDWTRITSGFSLSPQQTTTQGAAPTNNQYVQLHLPGTVPEES